MNQNKKLRFHFKDYRYPISSKGITLNEIPDKVAVYLELGNCLHECEGCHSADELWDSRHHIKSSDFMCLSDIMNYIYIQKERGAEAVVIMGGDCNTGVSTESLFKLIRQCELLFPVGIYVGAGEKSAIVKKLKESESLAWLKVGRYDKNLGGLGSPTTNQKFYRRNSEGEWVDHSFLFVQKGGENN